MLIGPSPLRDDPENPDSKPDVNSVRDPWPLIHACRCLVSASFVSWWSFLVLSFLLGPLCWSFGFSCRSCVLLLFGLSAAAPRSACPLPSPRDRAGRAESLSHSVNAIARPVTHKQPPEAQSGPHLDQRRDPLGASHSAGGQGPEAAPEVAGDAPESTPSPLLLGRYGDVNEDAALLVRGQPSPSSVSLTQAHPAGRCDHRAQAGGVIKPPYDSAAETSTSPWVRALDGDSLANFRPRRSSVVPSAAL